jgi:hypothetical protein
MHDDLKRRLRDEVAAELGTRPPSDLSDVLTRGRGKRLAQRLVTTMSIVLVGTAIVAGGLWIGRTISQNEGTSIQPADDNASPSEPFRCARQDSADHAGPRCLFDGEVAFDITAGWAEHFESRLISQEKGPESLSLHEGPSAGFLVIVLAEWSGGRLGRGAWRGGPSPPRAFFGGSRHRTDRRCGCPPPGRSPRRGSADLSRNWCHRRRAATNGGCAGHHGHPQDIFRAISAPCGGARPKDAPVSRRPTWGRCSDPCHSDRGRRGGLRRRR